MCFLHLGLFLEGWVTPQKWDVPGEDGRVELRDGTCVRVGGHARAASAYTLCPPFSPQG